MAFTSTNARQTSFFVNPPRQTTGPKLGPGVYTKQNLTQYINKNARQQSKQQINYNNNNSKSTKAPFGMTFGAEQNTSYYKPTYNPAPGEYNLNTSLIRPKIIKDKNDDSNYLLVDNGHLHRKPQAFTASKVDRFSKDRPDKVGPGIYKMPDKWKNDGTKEERNQTILENKKKLKSGIQKIKIKGRELQQQMGIYTEKERLGFGRKTQRFESEGERKNAGKHSKNGKLFQGRQSDSVLGRQSKTTEGFTKESIQERMNKLNDSKMYSSHSRIIRKTVAGVPFGLQKAQRKIKWQTKIPQTSAKLGPGAYQDQLGNKLNMTVDGQMFNRNNKYGLLQSGPKEDSIFISRIPRFPDDKIEPRAQTIHSKFKQIKENQTATDILSKTAQSTQIQQEIENSGKKRIPGPGFYYNSDLHTSFKPKTVPQVFQFFGSANERFKEEHPDDSNKLGPGRYDVVLKKDIRPGNTFISSTKKTEIVNTNQMQNPGPQNYNINKNASIRGKRVDDSHFGSTVKRFQGQTHFKASIPGPGTYIKASDRKMGKRVNREDHFGSLRPRNCLNLSTGAINPPVAQYTPASWLGTVGKNNQFKGGGAVNSLKVKNLSYEGQRAAFGSSTGRWIQKPSLQYFRGPGRYNVQDNSNKLSKLLRQQNNQNTAFLSNADRFDDEWKPIPGPGRYKQDNQWKQRSQNVRFNPQKHAPLKEQYFFDQYQQQYYY